MPRECNTLPLECHANAARMQIQLPRECHTHLAPERDVPARVFGAMGLTAIETTQM
jgi:hypothetical protein